MKIAARTLIAMTLACAALGLAVPVVAQDVTDNETCMECHAETDRSAPADPNMVQVHNPEGGFFHEAHEMWSCVDCHFLDADKFTNYWFFHLKAKFNCFLNPLH